MSKLNHLCIFFGFVLFSCVSMADLKSDDFYFKSLVTVNNISEIADSDIDSKFQLYHGAKLTPTIGVGVGYNINPNVRIEVVFEPLRFNFHHEKNEFSYIDNNALTLGTKSIKRKAYGRSLMFNSYLNVLNREYFSIFVGGGVGINQIKEKVCYSLAGNSTDPSFSLTFPQISKTFVGKSKVNAAYSLAVGTSIKCAPGVNVELMYSWRDYGKISYNAESTLKKHSYKGHYFSTGLRLDL